MNGKTTLGCYMICFVKILWLHTTRKAVSTFKELRSNSLLEKKQRRKNRAAMKPTHSRADTANKRASKRHAQTFLNTSLSENPSNDRGESIYL